MIWRFIKIIVLILIIFILLLGGYLFIGKAKPSEKVEWGVTFSKWPVIDFGMDWKKVFLAVLDDLKVKKIRIVAYWNVIEPEQGEYDFSELDWQINEIEKRGGEIIFAMGRKVPRWPECFEPEWAKDLSSSEKKEKILALISELVNRYKNRESIKIWQVENEPFFESFGMCSQLSNHKKFLDKEIALVRHLDPLRPIMITESGELSTWIGGARRGDVLGTSLYRKIYGKLQFYFTYPIPPVFYQRKVILAKLLFDLDEVIAVEVQAEPWGHKPNQDMTIEEQDMSMSFEDFENVLEYTRKAGFEKAYLWGVEYWYWRKNKFNDDRFWEKTKELFK